MNIKNGFLKSLLQISRGLTADINLPDICLFSVFDQKLCLAGNTNNLNLKLNGSHGTLQSPAGQHYNPGLLCEWLITVPEGKLVELTFDRFKLHPGYGSSCLSDSLQVYDGDYKSGVSMGIYCGHAVPESLNSSGRYMTVRFISENGYDSNYPGFKATFNAVDNKQVRS